MGEDLLFEKGHAMEATQQKQPLDMLSGPIWNKLPRYALPVAATAILEQLFNASDLAVVGNFTGKFRTIAVAAVGANSPVIGLVINLFVGIALGANVVIANAVGQRDGDTVRRTVHTAVLMSVIGGILVALLGQLAAGPLLGALSVPEDVLPFALRYLRIYLLGMPAILLYNFEAAIFRSVGDTKVPLQALIVSGILNVLMNLFFVAVLHMTVEGVATATVLANVFSAVILLRRLMRSDLDIRVEPRALRIHTDCMGRILRIGLPAGIQSAVFSVSNIVIQAAINSLGTVVMAGSSAAFSLELMAYYVLNSFGQACTTFVGQNYGAWKLERCKRTLVLTVAEDTIATAAAIALVLLAGRPILAIFNNDPQVIEVGYTRLVLVFSAYVFCMLYEVISGYLRGFGISLVPALLTTIGVCGIRISWIAFVFPRSPSFNTIMYVYFISLSSTALLLFLALLWFRPAKRAAEQG